MVSSGPGKAENIVSHLDGFVLYTVKYSVRLKSYMLWPLGCVHVEFHAKNVTVGKSILFLHPSQLRLLNIHLFLLSFICISFLVIGECT